MEVLIMVSLWVPLAIIFLFSFSKYNAIRYRRKGLPPGTMGWPFSGETSAFLSQGPDFMKKQRTRYGQIFKTHILGSPTVISMDPELNRYILLNEAKGLVPGYPKSMADILGTENIASVSGSDHKYLRSNLMSLIGALNVKERLLATVDKYMTLHLSDWDGINIDLQQKTMDMVFYMSFKMIAESESDSLHDRCRIEFDKLLNGSLALPVNFPGTKFYQGLVGRRNIIKLLTELIESRRASGVKSDDMLGLMLGMKNALGNEEIIDHIITILYSGYETVSRASMMSLKYLHDHPKALQELIDEHTEIRKRKKADELFDWDDYKSMRFTRAVILETLRLANIVNGVLRKTTHDMELKGFLIPKGWKVYVYTREVNYDPILYPEPMEFNPWRWLDTKLESHNYFFLFGNGSRLCPGKELGIVIVSVFLHYFVTKYRWEEVGGVILKFPRVDAPNGYHVNVMKI